MDSRRNIPPAYDAHIRQSSGMMHRVPHHPMEPLPSPVFLENKLASQAEEIERLSGDNRRLASSHISLRQDLVVAEQEAEKIREHIRSTKNEGDIQIRILLDKIAKMEADIRNGSNIKKELQEAHTEARSLVTDRQELTAKIQQATKELDKSRADVKKLPEMRAKLDSLREEHQRLRKTFEYEKGINVEKVEQMKIMEKDLIGLSSEVERLRAAEVSNAKKRAIAAPIAYSGQHELTSDNIYPPPLYHGNGVSFAIPHHHIHPYGGGGFAVGGQVISGPIGGVDGGGGFAVGAQVIGGTGVVGVVAGNNPPRGGGVYNKSHAQM